MSLHLLRTLCIDCGWSHVFFSYIRASKLHERTLRLPTARKVTRGGKMKVAFLVGGDFLWGAITAKIQLSLLS